MLVYDKNKPKTVSVEYILILQDNFIQFLEMDAKNSDGPYGSLLKEKNNE